ncbi:MAG TPA: tetratricopeptide repeat protein [Thermoanaerobaculia bacterium]|nr:tetratricopeptide repeat protein [Thermoanaerobaculia bacterium]
MLTSHPTAEDFNGFLSTATGQGAAARNALVLRHLLADCDTCREQLSAMGWDGRRLDRLLYLPGAEPLERQQVSYDYSAAFAKAERAYEALLDEVRPAEQAVEKMWADLDSRTQEEQVRLVGSERRFQHPEMIRLLVERSHGLRYSDPAKMLHVADLARLASEAATPAVAGNELRLADLRTHSWRQYGNALRISGRITEAEEALTKAQKHCKEGTGDPPLRAWLLEQMASLRIFQRRFEEAIEISDQAGQIYRDLGETHSLASTMVQKAIASLYSGEPENAVRILNRAIPLIDNEEDPHLLLAACHNLVRCYIDLERPEQALSLYSEAREIYQEFQDALIFLRAAWQEGQLLRDLGHLRAAETALVRARKGFMERSLAYEVAVVSLDLAAVYIKLGEAESVRQTVAETVPIFRALRVDRDALASLLQLQQVATQGQQALELIRFLSSRLEKLPSRQAGK